MYIQREEGKQLESYIKKKKTKKIYIQREIKRLELDSYAIIKSICLFKKKKQKQKTNALLVDSYQ